MTPTDLESSMKPTPCSNLQAACDAFDEFVGEPTDFELAIADTLLDPIGINMAIITDRILAKSWEPDGFEQCSSFRIYRYKQME